MILSMTGYGKASNQFEDKQISVEIKSLNGKSSDIRMRLPNNLKEKEIAIRRMILDSAIRGKFDFTLKVGSDNGSEEYALNTTLVKKYAEELKSLQTELSLNDSDILQSIMRIPNVVSAEEKDISPGEWEAIANTAKEALERLKTFREEEGVAMKKDLEERVEQIQSLLNQVSPLEESRILHIKERMQKNLNQWMNEDSVDQNRFEQEVLFYLEKLDITEEKVRLSQHCDYFKENLDDVKIEKGKKLGFISQEMGREINTLGAKAQQSDIQQLVVMMKDELEKIKEQLANII